MVRRAPHKNVVAGANTEGYFHNCEDWKVEELEPCDAETKL